MKILRSGPQCPCSYSSNEYNYRCDVDVLKQVTVLKSMWKVHFDRMFFKLSVRRGKREKEDEQTQRKRGWDVNQTLIGIEHIQHCGIFNMKWTVLKFWFWLQPFSDTSLLLCIRMKPSLVKGFYPLCGLFILSLLQGLHLKIPLIAKLLTVE